MIAPAGVGCNAWSGATPFHEYSAYPFEMMAYVVGLHLDDEPDRNPLHLPVSFANDHSTFPRFGYTLQELNDVSPARLQKLQ